MNKVSQAAPELYDAMKKAGLIEDESERGDGCVAPPCSAASGVERSPSLSAAVPPEQGKSWEEAVKALENAAFEFVAASTAKHLRPDTFAAWNEMKRDELQVAAVELASLVGLPAAASERKPESEAGPQSPSEWFDLLNSQTEASGRRNT